MQQRGRVVPILQVKSLHMHGGVIDSNHTSVKGAGNCLEGGSLRCGGEALVVHVLQVKVLEALSCVIHIVPLHLGAHTNCQNECIIIILRLYHTMFMSGLAVYTTK